MNRQSIQKAPKVSVLMTIYNAGPYLKEAIDSIVAQTFRDWELIAIENGSSDESPAILHSYNDERIRTFILPKNIGRTPALRYAFEQAQGEYIAVLDADDVSYPERLMKQVAHLDQNPKVGVVGTWARQINRLGEEIGRFNPPVDAKELHDMLGWCNPYVHSSIMYRTDIAKRVGGYPSEYVYAQDYAMILRIEKESMVAIMDEYLCKWRVLSSSMTQSAENRLLVADELYIIGRIAGQRNFIYDTSRKISLHRQAVAQLKLGLLRIKTNSLKKGFALVIGAVTSRPSCLIINGYTKRLYDNLK